MIWLLQRAFQGFPFTFQRGEGGNGSPLGRGGTRGEGGTPRYYVLTVGLTGLANIGWGDGGDPPMEACPSPSRNPESPPHQALGPPQYKISFAPFARISFLLFKTYHYIKDEIGIFWGQVPHHVKICTD